MAHSDADVNVPRDLTPIAEAAAKFGVSRRTLERLVQQGQLRRFRRPGDRRTFVSLDEVNRGLGFREVPSKYEP